MDYHEGNKKILHKSFKYRLIEKTDQMITSKNKKETAGERQSLFC